MKQFFGYLLLSWSLALPCSPLFADDADLDTPVDLFELFQKRLPRGKLAEPDHLPTRLFAPDEYEFLGDEDKSERVLGERKFLQVDMGLGAGYMRNRFRSENLGPPRGTISKDRSRWVGRIYTRFSLYRNQIEAIDPSGKVDHFGDIQAGLIEGYLSHDGEYMDFEIVPVRVEAGQYFAETESTRFALRALIEAFPVDFQRRPVGPFKRLVGVPIVRAGVGVMAKSHIFDRPIEISLEAGGVPFEALNVRYGTETYRKHDSLGNRIPDKQNFESGGSYAWQTYGRLIVKMDPITLEVKVEYREGKRTETGSRSNGGIGFDENRQTFEIEGSLLADLTETLKSYVRARYFEMKADLGDRDLRGDELIVEFGMIVQF